MTREAPRSDAPPPGRRRASDRAPDGYTPPGWPTEVHPPGTPGFEATATAFLLDRCPADYRGYPVLTRYPVVLARFAAECVDAQITAGETALSHCRAALEGYVAPSVIDEAVWAWQTETAALRRARREVGLVEEALRGMVFVRRL